MWPKRTEEVLDEGSVYWVIKGVILCRQRVIHFEEVDCGDGIRRCANVCDPNFKRAFQGWRYLKPEDAPRSLAPGREAERLLTPMLQAALSEIGIL